MPPRGGQGSTLANLAVDRARLNKARRLLGLGERGVSQPQPPLPPQSPPAQRPNPRAIEPLPQIPDGVRQTLRDRTEKFLNDMRAGPMAAPEGAPRVEIGNIPTDPGNLLERIEMRGATSPETQFWRLAGRAPSPRELAAFQTALSLQRRLGRPATQGELRAAILAEIPTGPAFPRAAEIPQEG